MTPISSPMLASGSLTASHGTDRAQLAGAAKQFEAIFLRQMLAAARKADFGDPLLGGQALDTFRTMQDEHFADLAAQTGAFGFGKLIERQLAAQLGGSAERGASTSSARAGLGNSPGSSPAQPERILSLSKAPPATETEPKHGI